jgi:hypothetical protein
MNFARTLINVVVFGILNNLYEKKLLGKNPFYIVSPYVTIFTNATPTLNYDLSQNLNTFNFADGC